MESGIESIAGISVLCCYLILCLVFFVGFIFWILMIVDVAQRNFPPGKENEKTMWLILLCASLPFGFHWIVALVYYFVVKRPYDQNSVTYYYPPQPSPSQPIPQAGDNKVFTSNAEESAEKAPE